MLLQTGLLSLVLLVAGLSLGEAAAQVGYYRTYRADPYREMSQTGKYHGYWRDLGYGVRPQQFDSFYPAYGVPHYDVYNYGGVYPYGGVPYGEIVPAPNYYHPPRSFPYRARF